MWVGGADVNLRQEKKRAGNSNCGCLAPGQDEMSKLERGRAGAAAFAESLTVFVVAMQCSAV